MIRSSKFPTYRWVLLLFFPLGYWLTEGLYDSQSGLYLTLSTVSFLSLVLVVWALNKLSVQAVMVALILAVIILGYYLKFYLLSYAFLHGWSSDELVGIFGYYVYDVISIGLLMDAYENTTYSFLFFSITSSLVLLRCKKKQLRVDSAVMKPVGTVYAVVIVALLLFILTSAIRLYFGLGSVVQEVVLPMKLGGITTITNSQVVPYLMVAALGYSYYTGRPKLGGRIAITFLILGVIQFLLFYSKMHLVLPLLALFLYRMIYGQYALGAKKLFLITFSVVLIYPFLNVYRSSSVSQGVQAISTFSAAAERSAERRQIDSVVSSLSLGASALFGRMTGLDSLLVIMDASGDFDDKSFIDKLFQEESITSVLTRDVIGIKDRGGVGEGMLGGFYYLTNNYYGTAILFSLWSIVVISVVYRMFSVSTALSVNMAVIWIIFCLQTVMGGIRVTSFTWFGFAFFMTYLILKVCEVKRTRTNSFVMKKTYSSAI